MDFALIRLALIRFITFVRYGGTNGRPIEQYITFVHTQESLQFTKYGIAVQHSHQSLHTLGKSIGN
jgi:hypothetical protein